MQNLRHAFTTERGPCSFVSMAISSKDLVGKFFKAQSDGVWECHCGVRRKKGQGWSNLLDHITRSHADSVQEAKSSQSSLSIASFFRTKDVNLFKWVTWIVEELHPFSFCENPNTRLFSKLGPVSRNTLKQSMMNLRLRLEKKIADILPDQFALAFDGWTDSCTHYLAVFAVYPDQAKEAGYDTALLCFCPLVDEESLNARSHHETIFETLQCYGKNFLNVACLIGDNCSVNQSLAKKSKCYLVGCASHRLNLGVQKFLRNYSDIIDSVRAVMIALRTIKLRAALRKKTNLSPVLDNVTRWSSKFKMVQRYSDLLEFLEDVVPLDLQLSPRDNASIQVLLKKMCQLEELTKFLQSEDVHIYQVRILFDKAIQLFDSLSEHCSSKSAIVCDPVFESAICKIQRNQINRDPLKLSPGEAKSVAHLTVDQSSNGGESDHSENQSAMMDDISEILRSVKRARVIADSKYVDCRFIRPTSNMCERLFSISKQVLTDSRKSLLPVNLETQIFLKLNRHLWDAELFHTNLPATTAE